MNEEHGQQQLCGLWTLGRRSSSWILCSLEKGITCCAVWSLCALLHTDVQFRDSGGHSYLCIKHINNKYWNQIVNIISDTYLVSRSTVNFSTPCPPRFGLPICFGCVAVWCLSRPVPAHVVPPANRTDVCLSDYCSYWNSKRSWTIKTSWTWWRAATRRHRRCPKWCPSKTFCWAKEDKKSRWETWLLSSPNFSETLPTEWCIWTRYPPLKLFTLAADIKATSEYKSCPHVPVLCNFHRF